MKVSRRPSLVKKWFLTPFLLDTFSSPLFFSNPHDPNAIAVYRMNGQQLGRLSKDLAPKIRNLRLDGYSFCAKIKALTGGGGLTRGVNLLVLQSKVTLSIEGQIHRYMEDNKEDFDDDDVDIGAEDDEEFAPYTQFQIPADASPNTQRTSCQSLTIIDVVPPTRPLPPRRPHFLIRRTVNSLGFDTS